jgi:hypothetical protein
MTLLWTLLLANPRYKGPGPCLPLTNFKSIISSCILAYFPKIIMGLWDHHHVCVSVCQPVPASTYVPLDRLSWDLFGSWCHSRRTSITSTILKWLRFKVVNLIHNFQACSAVVWDCLFDWLPWLHHTKFLADVTMVTKACNLQNAVKLY